MISILDKQNLDCVKFPDDFPVHFTGEVYRCGALRRLLTELDAIKDLEKRSF
jgi:hypothetical protein